MAASYQDHFLQRLITSMLDVQLLRVVQNRPLWGYKIKKDMETFFGVKIRHSILYPTLNALEKNGYLNSRKQTKSGRARKVYTLTEKGKRYIQSYYTVLQNQISNNDIS